MAFKERIRGLYYGHTEASDRFHYAILGLDIASIVYLVITSFFERDVWMNIADVTFGALMTMDWLARFWLANRRDRFITNPINIADAIATLSFLAPLLGLHLSFLRVLRLLRVMRSSRIRTVLREDFGYFKRNEDIINSSVNLFIFIFVMTEMVLISQRGINPHVKNFLDAMYFTISTLTTTGFGDITLKGTFGRILSVFVMIFGVSLFLRLIQTIIRPSKIRFLCDACGLFLHEADAVHCKHCGKVLAIPSDGTPT